MKSKEILTEEDRQIVKETLAQTDRLCSESVQQIFDALLAAEAELEEKSNIVLIPEWILEKVERYYYLSGRNYTTYVEVSYWYCKRTLSRKDTSRNITIADQDTYQLPEWTKCITDRMRKLDYV